MGGTPCPPPGQKVIWYGHSTEKDFRNSFTGSNLLAPLFKQWLRLCYNQADLIITPTPYSAKELAGYRLRPTIVPLSNGVDTRFFAPNPASRSILREKYRLAADKPVVISVGHYMQRKGILDFIALARKMPQVQFLWFGYTDPHLVPHNVKAAMADAPENLQFPGFLSQAELRTAYCGADAFLFCSYEETEGIVILEALACANAYAGAGHPGLSRLAAGQCKRPHLPHHAGPAHPLAGTFAAQTPRYCRSRPPNRRGAGITPYWSTIIGII